MIKDSYGRIIEATENEMFSAYLLNKWDDVMSFTEFLDKVSVNGTKIIKEGEGHRRMNKETPITEQIRKECKNLLHIQANSKLVSKCAIYGDTRSEASDWVQKWTACGKFDEEYKGRSVLNITEAWRKSKVEPDEPLEGQLTWEDV